MPFKPLHTDHVIPKEYKGRDMLRALKQLSTRNQELDADRLRVINSIEYFQQMHEQLLYELAKLNREMEAGINQFVELHQQYQDHYENRDQTTARQA